ncbi:hypothetical protein LCGC14_1263050 [marine sediment metagenome]|uniref:Uncharacterized protein n=1 Tax=marine sediment metagenome TaxID=412755 RepID=A0A0F9L2F7_9ZZZZ
MKNTKRKTTLEILWNVHTDFDNGKISVVEYLKEILECYSVQTLERIAQNGVSEKNKNIALCTLKFMGH